MDLIFFTKYWPEATIQELAGMARESGLQGLDLGVRPKLPVTPENIASALPEAVKTCESEGVKIVLVTLPGNPTDPLSPETETIFAACGEAGVPFVKVGYWSHNAGSDYWMEADRIRGELEKLGRLARKHGVTACHHTHSGLKFGSNAAEVMYLMKDQDTESLGIYLDMAHLFLNGEDVPMALDMLGEYLKLVAVKSPQFVDWKDNGITKWKSKWVPLREGLVDYPLIFQELSRVEFAGTISIHSETAEILANDAEFCREIIAGTAGS